MRAARRVREGARGKRPVATPAPRPRAYLTTALREAKASLDGAGPSAGPMLRSGSPGLVRQELAAWAAGNEMTRGVARAAALAAAPARKGRRAGSASRPARSPTAAPAARSSPRSAPGRPAARRWPGNSRNTAPSSTGTGTAPARPSAPAPSPAQDARTPLPGSPPPSSPSRTRPPDQRKHRQPPQDASPPARGTGRHPARHAGHRHARDQELPTVTKTQEPRTNTQMPKPHGIGAPPALQRPNR